jgi:hypothetical protein
MDAQDITIRVVVFKDNDMWVAQCLEYDIGAQADDIDTLNARLNAVLKAELKESIERHKAPLAGIPKAPQRLAGAARRRANFLRPRAWRNPTSAGGPSASRSPRPQGRLTPADSFSLNRHARCASRLAGYYELSPGRNATTAGVVRLDGNEFY